MGQRAGVVLTVPSAVPTRGQGMVIELDSAIKRAVQVAAGRTHAVAGKGGEDVSREGAVDDLLR